MYAESKGKEQKEQRKKLGNREELFHTRTYYKPETGPMSVIAAVARRR